MRLIGSNFGDFPEQSDSFFESSLSPRARKWTLRSSVTWATTEIYDKYPQLKLLCKSSNKISHRIQETHFLQVVAFGGRQLSSVHGRAC